VHELSPFNQPGIAICRWRRCILRVGAATQAPLIGRHRIGSVASGIDVPRGSAAARQQSRPVLRTAIHPDLPVPPRRPLRRSIKIAWCRDFQIGRRQHDAAFGFADLPARAIPGRRGRREAQRIRRRVQHHQH